MSLISIDIGSKHCTVVEGSEQKGVVRLNKVITAELPVGISDMSDITFGVYDILARILLNNGIKANRAIITVNNKHLTLRDFVLPDGNKAQLAGMVKNEMSSAYSSSGDILQFIKSEKPDVGPDAAGGIPDKMTGKNAKIKNVQTGIRAALIKREIVDNCYNMLRKMKLKTVAMDFHSNAIEKLMRGEVTINGAKPKNNACLLIDFGSSGTLVHAVSNGKVIVSRYMTLGVSDLDQIVGDKEFINLEQAKEFRLNKMDLSKRDWQQDADMQSTRLFLFKWIDELRKVISFIQTRISHGDINNLYIYGVGAQIKGLPEYISVSVGKEAQIIKSLSSVTFTDEGAKYAENICHCLNAAGAVIRLR